MSSKQKTGKKTFTSEKARYDAKLTAIHLFILILVTARNTVQTLRKVKRTRERIER